uniref:Exophilin 5 n=1 Tax=Romanomermis culicivorax TaxID=13658 RepID=A0A915KT91_ROMCU
SKESDSDSLASYKLQPVKQIGIANGKRKAKSISRQSTSSESNAFGYQKRRSTSLNQRKKKNFPPYNGAPSTVVVEQPLDSKSKEDEDTTLLSHFSSPTNQIAINQSGAPPLPRLRINLNTKTVRLVPKDDNLDDNLAPPTFNDLEYRSTSSSLSDSQESAIDFCFMNNNHNNNDALTLDYMNSVETPITFYTPRPSSEEPGSSTTLDDSKNYSSYVTPFSSPPDLSDRKTSAVGATKSLEDNLKLFESRCTSKMSDYSVNNFSILRRPRSVPMMKSRLIFGARYRANSSAYLIEDKNDNYHSKNNSRRKIRCSTPFALVLYDYCNFDYRFYKSFILERLRFYRKKFLHLKLLMFLSDTI